MTERFRIRDRHPVLVRIVQHRAQRHREREIREVIAVAVRLQMTEENSFLHFPF